MKRLLTALLLLTLAAPAFINVRYDHDWGDDFAMYILEARQIALGLPLSDLGFVYDPVSSWGGPPAYPVGFPLMLAPVYYFFGLSFRHFHYLTSAFAAAFSMLTFLYLRGKTESLSGAYALAAMLAFNPLLIDFKNTVLSDLLFAVLVLLVVLAAERRRPYLAGLALGYAFLTRTAAVALAAGIIADVLYRCIRKPRLEESTKSVLTHASITAIVAVVFYLSIGAFYRTPAGSDSGYLNLFQQVTSVRELVHINFNHYLAASRFFIPGVQSAFSSRAIWVLLVGCAVTGYLSKLRMGPHLPEFFVLTYLGMVLLYPSWQGFRFLLPIIPMMLCYVYFGISKVAVLFGRKVRYVPILAVLLIGWLFYPFLMELQRNHRQPIEGPMLPEAQEVYREIQRSTPSDAVFFAEKPRALVLFTGRKAAFEVLSLPPEAFRDFVKQKNIHYELVDLASGPAGVAEHKKQIPPDIKSTDWWSNARFLILKLDWEFAEQGTK